MNNTTNGTSTTPKYVKTIASNVAKSQIKKVATQKFLDTTAGKALGKMLFNSAHTVVSSACKTQAGKTIVAKTATGVAKKTLAGAASRSVVSASMKSNVVTAGIGLVLTSVGDIVQVCRGKQSGSEFAKKMAKNTAETGGGMAGSGIGAAVGSLVCPGVGTAIGGFLGGMFGSIGARCLC